jgi:perosamine synthetase
MTTLFPVPLVKVAMPPPERLMPALQAVLYSGMLAEGDVVYEFEAAFSKHFSLSHVLAMSSGSAALHVAFLLAGVLPGDEIITTAMTAEPTNTTILQVGAIPVFADVEPETGNLCPDSVAKCITPKTKAICVVHYAGYPAKLDELRTLADRFGLKLIEDCAHALGARFKGQPIGSFGDFSIFSFQSIKHMTTVDGGMLVVREASMLDLGRRLRWFGLRKGQPRTSNNITVSGFKYNMTNVTATIGLAQLAWINELLLRHVENGRSLDNALAGLSKESPSPVLDGAEPTYWVYTLLSTRADELINELNSRGFMASKLHRPSTYHSVFAPFRKHLPGLDLFYARLVHLPCGWWLSPENRKNMVDLIEGR